MSTNIEVYKISWDDHFIVTDNHREVLAMFEEAFCQMPKGERLIFEVLEMTEEEYNALPEY